MSLGDFQLCGKYKVIEIQIIVSIAGASMAREEHCLRISRLPVGYPEPLH
jgi:hypothetical protein